MQKDQEQKDLIGAFLRRAYDGGSWDQTAERHMPAPCLGNEHIIPSVLAVTLANFTRVEAGTGLSPPALPAYPRQARVQ